ncbi:hypothetical protein [Plantibacter sp. YIM 135249]|uniref:hypothetical protein n=1 Tax=Plantibacter sp. YIM 135249 TaxID=3423918 RepID=UPI003D33A2ED
MPEMTERQANAWPGVLAEIQRDVDTSTVSDDLSDWQWTVVWEDESRPGRGNAMRAMWCDGEYVASVTMDVYGGPGVGVAQTDWLHNSSDEECECEHCVAERDDEPEPTDSEADRG